MLWEHWDRCAFHWFPGNHVLHVSQPDYLRRMTRFMRDFMFRLRPDHPFDGADQAVARDIGPASGSVPGTGRRSDPQYSASDVVAAVQPRSPNHSAGASCSL